MSTTPRTNAEQFAFGVARVNCPDDDFPLTTAKFSRQLEREVIEQDQTIADLKAKLAEYKAGHARYEPVRT